MTKKVFRAIVLVSAVVFILVVAVVIGGLYDYFGSVQENQLRDEAELASAAVEDAGMDYIQKLKLERYRVTWVAADGSVIYDTLSDVSSMSNHADREEISEALKFGKGESTRYSSTLLEKTVYFAKRLSDGTVLRISISRATIGALALDMLRLILPVLLVVTVLAFILARCISKRIARPLNNLDLDNPLENETYEELAPLLGRLNQQQRSISEQISQLRRQRDEFSQITDSMREGLVLLDATGVIVSVNPTARRLFNAEENCISKDFLTIERSNEIHRAIETALAEGHSEIRMERAGRLHQFDISRIDSDGNTVGTVLIAFDVTERELAERNRREFTANVSHELKTPLQSIIGSADLIENDLVKPEDMPRFVGHIKQEAARLVTLIEDIIRLSQLDEGTELPMQDVELLGLCEDVSVNLHDAAQSNKIYVSVDGVETTVHGVRRLLYEVIYNLCDNAIKYNVNGGRVDIIVTSDERNAIVEIKDTGIGIPPEHQSRVFERFYRVDKSHSKASGGTGLGLSIVKHAVAYHHGSIALVSAPGKGTTITVTLPLSTLNG